VISKMHHEQFPLPGPVCRIHFNTEPGSAANSVLEFPPETEQAPGIRSADVQHPAGIIGEFIDSQLSADSLDLGILKWQPGFIQSHDLERMSQLQPVTTRITPVDRRHPK